MGYDPAMRLPVFHDQVPDAFDESLLADVAQRYRAAQSAPLRGGSMMLVTAGPPGAGKSHWVGQHTDINDYLRIDPDEIKDLLLGEAEQVGLLKDAQGITLSDGRPITSRELSGRVHEASNKVAALVLRRSLARRENVVLEGTLSWAPLAAVYAADLLDHEYEYLHIVDVEVPPGLALEGAIARWWAGRTGSDPLGGRFLSKASVHSFYDEPVHNQRRSRCTAVADALYEYTRHDLHVEYRRVERDEEGNESVSLVQSSS